MGLIQVLLNLNNLLNLLMALNATGTLVVPPLSDNEEWFINVAAWNNYWTDIPLDITLTGADTTIYVPHVPNYALPFVQMAMEDGTTQDFPTKAQFNDLLTLVTTLNTSYELLRTELRAAGLITNAQ